ncbi:hypothetical protein [Neobacillus massiliamazoniensis]|uniref:Uncharacterized protein n=1 Tax=Neobacillus massiliamazoniensis TaxID=1499688 RepID=A0A0U1NY98_9BACI|nr:hypothetical protein [Neobacillus massiliamazoniensis]CRK83000.1 hypothetical protein BN000_02955 [Neobacillus massiliamazoniensis]
MNSMLTHKLLKGIAYLSFVSGALVFVGAFIFMPNVYSSARGGLVFLAFAALLSGIISSAMFLFCAKLIEQNEERREQNEKLLKLLSNIDDRSRKWELQNHE